MHKLALRFKTFRKRLRPSRRTRDEPTHSRDSKQVYRDLDESEVRFVRLLPGAWDDPIKCSITYCSVDEAPKFIALSYVWGDLKDTSNILLDGKPFRITTNLFDALKQLRAYIADPSNAPDAFSSQGILLWIDALCINQTDLNEKSQQVPHIGTIYKSAELVVAWLGTQGPSDPSLDYLFDVARKLMAVNSAYKAGGSHQANDDDIEASTALQDPRVTLPVAQFASAFRPAYLDVRSQNDIFHLGKEFSDLLARSWFSRVWVIQEAILANNAPIFILGSHWCEFNGMASIPRFMWLCRNGFEAIRESNRGWRLANFEDIRSQILAQQSKFYSSAIADEASDQNVDNEDRAQNGASIVSSADDSVMQRCSQYLTATLSIIMSNLHGTSYATVPHDHIYGLLGMIDPPAYPPSLVPDYTVPFEQVFKRYATEILRTTGDLSIIPRTSGNLVDMPSWVPDFRAARADFRLDTSMLSNLCDVSFEDGDNICVIKGVRKGEVVSSICPTTQTSRDLDEIVNALSAFDKLIDTACEIRKADKPSVVADFFEEWLTSLSSSQMDRAMQFYAQAVASTPLPPYEDDDWCDLYTLSRLGDALTGQYNFVTSTGDLGMMKQEDVVVENGDVLAAVKGASYAFLLRPASVEGRYTFLGNVFIHGEPNKIRTNPDYFEGKVVEEFRLV